MAIVKNPSIYDDRSTIGSVDELDEYGVWVKIEPQELSEADADTFPDFDADFGQELSLDEKLQGDAAFGDVSYSGGGEGADFDDVEALRQDMESFSPVEPAEAPVAEPTVEPQAPEASKDLSTRLLMKIVDELSSIKEELSALKGELVKIRSEKPSGGEAEEAGFFDEEDDDKIALTGDELDNILHTAKFTEETGFDTAGSPADDFVKPDTPPSEGAESADENPDRNSAGADETAQDPQTDDDLRTLQEIGVEPMTSAPEDTSYLEEDPLAGEGIDLSDAVIDEPDLSEGLKDTPPEEPSPDSLSLIDLENIGGQAPAAQNEETFAEELSFGDIAFEDLPDIKALPESESMADLVNLDEGETIDLSIFEDDFLRENTGALDGPPEAGDMSFEAPEEDAKPPLRDDAGNHFESLSPDDKGEVDEVTVDEDLEQSLPEDMNIELDFPSPELEELVQPEAGEDTNFDPPGSEDAGDPAISPAIKMELKDVLVYMDKLLESLPEEKIHEFARSEHYNTYKKLFEELGIT
jgi:hypothetical protein